VWHSLKEYAPQTKIFEESFFFSFRDKKHIRNPKPCRANGPSPAPFYQCIKTSLKSVVRDESVIATLRDAALRANGALP
jgi:hypothetical protein